MEYYLVTSNADIFGRYEIKRHIIKALKLIYLQLKSISVYAQFEVSRISWDERCRVSPALADRP